MERGRGMGLGLGIWFLDRRVAGFKHRSNTRVIERRDAVP